MPAQFTKHFVQDLQQDIKIRQCGTIVFNADNLSNVISVELYNGTEPYSGGGTVAGAVICPDGATVALDNGTLTGNVASVTLKADCFAIPGQIGVGVQVISGNIRTTVLKAIYNVELLSTDNIVDPDSRITASVTQLVADIEAATAEIPASDMAALMAGIAPTFSTSTAYPAGAYVYYNGTLYRFTSAHAAGSWTGTDATAVALGNDVSDLKSAYSDSIVNTMRHNTAFHSGKVYYAPHSFISGRTYRIDIDYDSELDNYTTTNTNFSIVNSSWASSGQDSDIVERITGTGFLSTETKGHINLLYHCHNDGAGLAYYIGESLNANTIRIIDITDVRPNGYMKFPSNRNATSVTFSTEIIGGIPYILHVKNTNETRKRLEVTGIDKIDFTETERIFGGQVGADVDAYYTFTAVDSWYLVVTSSITSGLEWELFVDTKAYNDISDYTKIEDIIGYKQIQTRKSAEGGAGFYAVQNVNFVAGNDYIINVSKPDGTNILLSGLAFGSYNGSIDNRTMVDETITTLANTNCGNNYYFRYSPSGNASNLLIYADNSTSTIITVKVFRYAVNKDGLHDFYINPVFKARDTSDPTIWDGHDGYYYCLGSPWTSTDYGVLRSANMIDWENTGVYPFDSTVTNLFETYRYGVWAPCCVYLNGVYLMYISIVRATKQIIVVCKSRTPYGKFTLINTIIDSDIQNISDSIDPDVVVGDDGKTYMFFGSTGGIYRVKLTDDGLNIDGEPVHVAGTTDTSELRIRAFEGAHIYYRKGFWYLFVSSGEFNNNSYALRVGRSQSIDGVFIDKSGNLMTGGYAETLTQTASNDVFNGAGHNGLIFTAKNGKTYIFYHAHDVGSQYLFDTPISRNIKSRMLFVQELKWDADGWPHFDDSKPINIDSRPVI